MIVVMEISSFNQALLSRAMRPPSNPKASCSLDGLASDALAAYIIFIGIAESAGMISPLAIAVIVSDF
jgi:hypothetical protein